MRLQIIYYGNPILRKKCESIPEVNSDIQQIVKDMVETMDLSNGIGLAAPQIGHSLRLFVCRFYEHQQEDHFTISAEWYAFINPKITLINRETEIHDEGCLSMPGFTVPVARPLKIKVEAIDFNGVPFEMELEGFNARVILHENDHLNGVLHIDRTDDAHRKQVEPLLKSIKQTQLEHS